MNRYRIVSQDKNYNGKLGKPDIKRIVYNFKEHYYDAEGTQPQIGGFEINGGIGLTAGAKQELEDFKIWCEEKGLVCIYNSFEELNCIQNNLSNRVHNENYNI